MSTWQQKAVQSARTGGKKGVSGFIWMLKILIPISFLTLLLDASGLISRLDFVLSPAMGIFSLPSEAALPLIVGLLTGIYGAVASMTVLSLTQAQMTLVAIFLLISHNMVQEGIIQGKSGIHPLKATLFRLAASIVTVWIVSLILPMDEPAGTFGNDLLPAEQPFTVLLQQWSIAILWLSLKIFAIIMTLMVVIEMMKTFKVIPFILKGCSPMLKIMGLDRSVGMLWLTASLFGIAYGGAVIVEEAKENRFDETVLNRLHLSIGINHAVIEDPALFLPLGIAPFWLWIPRLLSAVAAVHALKLWQMYQARRIRKVLPVQSG